MSLIKGDIESMRLMSRNLERQGDTVDALLPELRNQLHSTEWTGHAANQFRSAWQREFEPAARTSSGCGQPPTVHAVPVTLAIQVPTPVRGGIDSEPLKNDGERIGGHRRRC